MSRTMIQHDPEPTTPADYLLWLRRSVRNWYGDEPDAEITRILGYIDELIERANRQTTTERRTPSGDAWAVVLRCIDAAGQWYTRYAAICALRSTAERLCPSTGNLPTVRRVTLYDINGVTYGPVTVEPPTDWEARQHADGQAAQAVAERARALGLSDDDLRALRSLPS